MLSNIENLQFLNILQAPSSSHKVYTCRPSHALIFKIYGAVKYTFENEILYLSDGEVLFLPEGISFLVERACQESTSYIAINFHANIPHARPKKLRITESLNFKQLCTKLCRYQVLDTAAERYQAISLLYDILAHLCAPGTDGYHDSAALKKLAPAAEYLKDNLFDPELKIGILHSLCGVSNTYFRKLFIACYGTSPKKYVTQKRLLQAKNILDSGEYDSISQVALLSGFDDPLYFSKVFRDRFGYPPSQC